MIGRTAKFVREHERQRFPNPTGLSSRVQTLSWSSQQDQATADLAAQAAVMRDMELTLLRGVVARMYPRMAASHAGQGPRK